jgi:hypothetical protein
MKRQRAQELRAAVDRLPLVTRQNMLRGLDRNNIIVGADGNVHGGRCPMMAASVGSSKATGKPFARAWDAYAGVRFSRPATRHELQTLRTMLQASIEMEVEQPVDLTAAISRLSVPEEATVETPARETPARDVDLGPPVDLRAAIDEHRASKERSLAAERERARPRKPERADRPERADTGERDRTRELQGRHGWAWLRPFRRLDEFERAVHHLEEAERAGLAAYKEDGATPPSRRPYSSQGRDRQPVGTPPGGW